MLRAGQFIDDRFALVSEYSVDWRIVGGDRLLGRIDNDDPTLWETE